MGHGALGNAHEQHAWAGLSAEQGFPRNMSLDFIIRAGTARVPIADDLVGRDRETRAARYVLDIR
jgi:hypothetical protein